MRGGVENGVTIGEKYNYVFCSVVGSRWAAFAPGTVV
jgi:hypothetical protein